MFLPPESAARKWDSEITKARQHDAWLAFETDIHQSPTLPPGTYWLYLKMQDFQLRLHPEPIQSETIELGSLELEVVVPEPSPKEPAQAFDLGSLELKR